MQSVVATDHKAQRNILIAMITALVAVIASVSGLNVAQTDLAVDLGASQNDVLWIINAYTIALAALLLPVGAVGDRWGRKPVLLSGLAVFGLASLAAALAPSVPFMIVARVAAGVGAAMIMPVTLSVITSSFPPEDSSRGDRHLGRVRRQRRHPRTVLRVVHGRHRHLALDVRPPARPRRRLRRHDR